MNRPVITTLMIISLGTITLGGCKKETPQKTEAPTPAPAPSTAPPSMEAAKTGEALYKQHCTVCHPDGGNTIKPEYTLHGAALKAHNISRPEDIVAKMRKPGPGMTAFDEKTIPDKDAKEIAEYVLKTFK